MEATDRGTDRAQELRTSLIERNLLPDPMAVEGDMMMADGWRFEPLEELAHNLVEQMIKQARTIRDMNDQLESQRRTIVKMDRGLIRRDRLIAEINHAVTEAETHPEICPPTLGDIFGPWWREVRQYVTGEH